jgi:hypothetical protein
MNCVTKLKNTISNILIVFVVTIILLVAFRISTFIMICFILAGIGITFKLWLDDSDKEDDDPDDTNKTCF